MRNWSLVMISAAQSRKYGINASAQPGLHVLGTSEQAASVQHSRDSVVAIACWILSHSDPKLDGPATAGGPGGGGGGAAGPSMLEHMLISGSQLSAEKSVVTSGSWLAEHAVK